MARLHPLLFALALALPVGATAVSAVWAAPPSRERDSQVRERKSPTRHFQQLCSRCHGNDFAGTRWRERGREMPDFTNRTWQKSRTDAQLLVSIVEGKGRHMPAFAGKLNEDTSRELVSLIRKFDPTPRQAPGAASTSFAKRYADLRKELDVLRKEFRALKGH
jgi:hypothetical protein